MGLQAVLRLLFPPQCLLCGTLVTTDFGLCGSCWRDTPFIAGPLVCDLCGTPLPGEDGDHAAHCDDCLALGRPWDHGRAAMLYRDNGRKLALALKHGDRLDLVRPAAGWMLKAARPVLTPGTLVVPVPLYWTRLLARRYNQSALLSAELARQGQLDHCPDALVRGRNTHSQDGRSREGRFDNMTGAIRPHPRRGGLLRGRRVLLVDDVMTSGATLAAATEACHGAGATEVSVAVLARVAKDA
ncbi:double zinc ribbon domain-containing protein [Rhodobacter sp. NSM]|uniref:double zinc ribbon domain-containing protein n=1 Tax=Rhodobacter sp. NSM TaxID=3457501 RepID=UPI003FD67C54